MCDSAGDVERAMGRMRGGSEGLSDTAGEALLKNSVLSILSITRWKGSRTRGDENQASVAPNPLVSFLGRLVAHSGRKCGNRQTDGYTERLL